MSVFLLILGKITEFDSGMRQKPHMQAKSRVIVIAVHPSPQAFTRASGKKKQKINKFMKGFCKNVKRKWKAWNRGRG